MKIAKFAFFLFVFLFFAKQLEAAAVVERPIVLVITSYNNKDWYKKNLDAAFNQNYKNFRIIYVDDCSPDGTGDFVEAYIYEKGWQDRVILVKNEVRKGKVANFYYAVHEFCEDKEIAIDYDGDDFLAHNNVLSVINKAYQDPNVWITYGDYVTWPGKTTSWCKPLPAEIVKNNSYRDKAWFTSHIKTFYAWLFKKIEPEDLQYEGKFMDSTGDLAIMYPMLEMACWRVKYIPEVLYLYNRANPINDNKVNRKRQGLLHGVICGKRRYSVLEKSPL